MMTQPSTSPLLPRSVLGEPFDASIRCLPRKVWMTWRSLLAITLSLSSLLLGNLMMYPVAPLLLPPSQHVEQHGLLSHCHRRVELSIATASFILATSLRTLIMQPLYRLERIGLKLHRDEVGGCYGWLMGIVHVIDSIIDGLELFSHKAWEEAARQSGMLTKEVDGPGSSAHTFNARHNNVPEIDLNLLVPCKIELATKQLLGIKTKCDLHEIKGDNHVFQECLREECSSNSNSNSNSKNEDICRLRDVITRNLLVDYAKLLYDDTFDLETHPIILRNLWPPESFEETASVVDNDDISCCLSRSGHMHRKLTPDAILHDPQLSNLLLPNYFSDAANKTGYAALVPDVSTSQFTLSQFIEGLLSGDFPNSKIGTQLIIE